MKNICVGILLLGLPIISTGVGADIDDFYKAKIVCSAIDDTGLLRKPCEVRRDDATIRASLEVPDRREAKGMCRGVKAMVEHGGIRFNERGWQVRISSPVGANITLAQCSLPSS